MKQKNSLLLASVLTGVLLCAGSLTASAYTPDDVAAKARQAGWPEYLIQMGYNEWSSGAYTQDKLDKAYESIQDYNSKTKNMICNYYGLDPDEVPDPADARTVSGESSGAEAEQPSEETSSASSGTLETVTKADGTVAERIAPSDFINMTFEEKQDYVASLDEASKAAFVGDMTTEERNSMLKQMPVEDKAALLESYVDTASTMGLNVTVDELSNDNISLTVRNETGRVVEKAAVGVTVDETGISYTKPLLTAALGVLVSVLGFGGLYQRLRRTEEEDT